MGSCLIRSILTEITSKMNKIDEQLDEIYKLGSDESTADTALSMVFNIIEGNFANRDIDKVNEYLGKLDVKRAHQRVLVGSLRAGFRANRALPNWYGLLIATQAELEARGLDSKRMLRGLIQDGTVK
jgi:hypothetical protein